MNGITGDKFIDLFIGHPDLFIDQLDGFKRVFGLDHSITGRHDVFLGSVGLLQFVVVILKELSLDFTGKVLVLDAAATLGLQVALDDVCTQLVAQALLKCDLGLIDPGHSFVTLDGNKVTALLIKLNPALEDHFGCDLAATDGVVQRYRCSSQALACQQLAVVLGKVSSIQAGAKPDVLVASIQKRSVN